MSPSLASSSLSVDEILVQPGRLFSWKGLVNVPFAPVTKKQVYSMWGSLPPSLITLIQAGGCPWVTLCPQLRQCTNLLLAGDLQWRGLHNMAATYRCMHPLTPEVSAPGSFSSQLSTPTLLRPDSSFCLLQKLFSPSQIEIQSSHLAIFLPGSLFAGSGKTRHLEISPDQPGLGVQ